MGKTAYFFATAFIFLSGVLHAQVQVHAKMEKKDFLKGEAVRCVVTLTNRTGADLLLQGDPATGLSWLDFTVKKGSGQRMTPFKRQLFRGAKVPMGQSVSKTVDLSRFYNVRSEGHFGVGVTVRASGQYEGEFRSNSVFFNVAKGQTVWSQRVGVPGKPQDIREYRLISFTARDRTKLYVQVADTKTDIELSSTNLGESLFIVKPKAMIDSKNHMHVLFMMSPTVFAKVGFDYSGKFIGRTFYKRGQGSAPRLISTKNGVIDVVGGVVYDPKKEQEKRSTTHGLSERPGGTYR